MVALKRSGEFLLMSIIFLNFLIFGLLRAVFSTITFAFPREAWEVYGAIIGLLLISISYGLVLKKTMSNTSIVRLSSTDRLMTLFFLFSLLSGFIGLLHSNKFTYLIGDVLRYSLLPLSYFIARNFINKQNITRLFYFILALEIIDSLIKLFIDMYLIKIGILFQPGFSRGLAASFLPLIVALLKINDNHNLKPTHRVFWFVVFFINSITIVISMYRAYWLVMLLSIALVLFLNRKPFNFIKQIIKISVVSLIIFLILMPIYNDLPDVIIKKISDRLESSTDSRTDWSLSYRKEEIKHVLMHFEKEGTLLDYIVGFGAGAEYYLGLANRVEGSDSSYSHFVHNTYFSIFLRAGLIGNLLFVGILISVLKLWRNIRSLSVGSISTFDSTIVKSIYIFFVGCIVTTFTRNEIIGSVQSGILIAILFASLKIIRSMNTREERPEGV